jgi:hypothetical protein
MFMNVPQDAGTEENERAWVKRVEGLIATRKDTNDTERVFPDRRIEQARLGA